MAFVHFAVMAAALLFYGLWLVIGIMALWNGLIRPRSTGLIVLGVLTLGAWGLIVVAVVAQERWLYALDLNPEVERDDVVGAWVDDEARLLLRDDSAFAISARGSVARRLSLQEAGGKWAWKRAQRQVELTPTGQSYHVALTVVAHDDRFRLITPLIDPDTYDGWRGLKRVGNEMQPAADGP